MEEKTRKALTHLFSILLGVLFILDGIARLAGVRMPFEIVSTGFYPTWLSIGVSLFELTGGILLMIEDIRFYGAVLTVVSTIVGIGYGLGSTEYLMLALPVVFFLGSWIIAFSTMPEGLHRVACSMPLVRMTHACKVSHHHS
jgi:uncharacterized membrane protein YphA (DoxX/SURF4 family)